MKKSVTLHANWLNVSTTQVIHGTPPVKNSRFSPQLKQQ